MSSSSIVLFVGIMIPLIAVALWAAGTVAVVVSLVPLVLAAALGRRTTRCDRDPLIAIDC